MKMLFTLTSEEIKDMVSTREVTYYVNKKLSELIESWPVVYEVTNSAGIQSWLHIEAIGATRKARLALIEPINKPPCNHIPIDHWSGDYASALRPFVTCQLCGVELESKWSEKK